MQPMAVALGSCGICTEAIVSEQHIRLRPLLDRVALYKTGLSCQHYFHLMCIHGYIVFDNKVRNWLWPAFTDALARRAGMPDKLSAHICASKVQACTDVAEMMLCRQPAPYAK